MTPSSSSRDEPLVGAPVVRRGGHWWLVSGSGSLLATDPTFTGELDRFAAARAAAEREIAALAPERRRWWS
ncbi:hypothetical protein [Kitasatospora phosalacinea]|uniref:Uncharacterized protein n=1 Tax=Kitasatospora phosalacinea TaxID=2065 RepID=A0A9W6UPZ4_9ACTN|nr:hypothetical protein [Kitasatospora phosalacinea]GLW58001.1 hypothetical protein Kpho01_60120 [Kitasatospora phosalacinea]